MLKKTALAVLISGFAIASFAATTPAVSAKPAEQAAPSHKAGASTGKQKHEHQHHKKGEAKAETPAAPAK